MNYLKKEIEEYICNNKKMSEDNEQLNNIINIQKFEIDGLKLRLNNEERKYNNEYDDKEILESKLNEYKLRIEQLKNKNEYLYGIIYGKPKKF